MNDQTALEFLILMKVDAYYQSRSPAELWLLFGKKRFARFRFARFGLQPSAVYQSPQTGLGGPPEDIGKLLASSFSEGELRAHATDSGISFCFSVRDHSALLRLVAGLSIFFSDRCRFSLFAFSALSLFIFFRSEASLFCLSPYLPSQRQVDSWLFDFTDHFQLGQCGRFNCRE